MSEQPVVQPEEPTAAEAAPATTEQVTEAILSKDPEVVEANLAKAGPVVTDPIEPVTADAAPAAATDAAPAATTEETPAATEATPAETPAPAKKEGSTLVAFLKKAIPNPKSVDKKTAKPETPAKTETETAPATEVVEPATEEGPFEGDAVSFKSHGGIFGGGWKDRRLEFGKEDGLSTAALVPYIGTHKLASVVSPVDKIKAAWDNAAHATVTGVGLLYITKFKNLEVPINVINLADITTVTVTGTHFTIKTEHAGDYEFNTNSPEKAQKWKTEIDTRAEQAKHTRSGVVESDKYKESFAYFQDLRGSHKAETAVTSDEEAGVSGDESKRPKGWTRRISGSFGKLTGGSKDKEPATEAPREIPVVAPTESTADATPETADVEAPVAAEVTEPAGTEAPAETPATEEPEMSKKEKRKSFTGFGSFFKSKTAKESSPEPASKEPASEETPVVEPTSDETPAATAETPAATEEPAPTTPEVKEKSKRQSFFMGFPRKEKPAPAPVTNGETPAGQAEPSEQPTTTEEAPATTEEAEYKPPVTERKESLARRLTSQFKSLGRSKSPEKTAKATKVSDEAPKIDTPIESTPAATSDAPPAAAEPLATTEAPAVEVPTTTATEPTPAVVTTQA